MDDIARRRLVILYVKSPDGMAYDRPITGLRYRQGSVKKQSSPTTSSPIPVPIPTSEPSSWRYYVRWTARILLILLLLLSTAKVVRLPANSPLVQPPFTDTILLVITHSRASYLKRTLDSVLAHRSPSWPVVISVDRQDGLAHDDVLAVIDAARAASPSNVVTWLHDASYPPDDALHDTDAFFADEVAYTRISRHYRWALARAFAQPSVTRVVVLEDDLEVAEDFFAYFDALAPVLDADPSLFCISAWNDNSRPHFGASAEQLHRTDFFPGLGWMLTRVLWQELASGWPDIYWDDWLRSDSIRRGRQCVRPERSRTANFGAEGVSQSFQYQKHVSRVVLSEGFVDFGALDLSYLAPESYAAVVFGRMSKAVLLKYSNYLTSKPQEADVIARFPEGNMELVGKRMGIMTDHREGLFRTSYRGVVIVPWNGHWAFLVPRGWEPPEGHKLGSSVCCGRHTTEDT